MADSGKPCCPSPPGSNASQPERSRPRPLPARRRPGSCGITAAPPKRISPRATRPPSLRHTAPTVLPSRTSCCWPPASGWPVTSSGNGWAAALASGAGRLLPSPTRSDSTRMRSPAGSRSSRPRQVACPDSRLSHAVPSHEVSPPALARPRAEICTRPLRVAVSMRSGPPRNCAETACALRLSPVNSISPRTCSNRGRASGNRVSPRKDSRPASVVSRLWRNGTFRLKASLIGPLPPSPSVKPRSRWPTGLELANRMKSSMAPCATPSTCRISSRWTRSGMTALTGDSATPKIRAWLDVTSMDLPWNCTRAWMPSMRGQPGTYWITASLTCASTRNMPSPRSNGNRSRSPFRTSCTLSACPATTPCFTQLTV